VLQVVDVTASLLTLHDDNFTDQIRFVNDKCVYFMLKLETGDGFPHAEDTPSPGNFNHECFPRWCAVSLAPCTRTRQPVLFTRG